MGAWLLAVGAGLLAGWIAYGVQFQAPYVLPSLLGITIMAALWHHFEKRWR